MNLADALLNIKPAKKPTAKRDYKRKADTPPPEHGRNQYTGGYTLAEIDARMQEIVAVVREYKPGELVAKHKMQRRMKYIVGLFEGLELAHKLGYLREVKLRMGCVTYMRTDKE